MEIKYEEKVVAFIDVLGFSNLVFSDKTEPITEYYKMVLTDFKKAASKNDLKFLLISDSIVVHSRLDKQEFMNVIKIICDLQHRLLLKGILIRGGISFGKLFVNDIENIIVGTGLINAYNLEQKAIYPRIIIDRKFINLYWSGSKEFEKKTGRFIQLAAPEPYQKDFPFINIGLAIALDFQPIKFNSVINTLKQNYYNNEHITKFEWLKTHINDSVRSSCTYLESKITKTKNEVKRIRLMTDFLTEFEKI